MNIGVQAQLLVPPRTGTGQYTRHLLRELFRLDKKNFYDLLLFDASGAESEYFGEPDKNFKYSFVKFPPFRIYRLAYKLGLRTPVELVFGRHDLHFSSTFYLFPPSSGKKVITIHDLAYLDAPQFITPAYKTWQESQTRMWARKADGMVANSNYTKKRIIDALGVEESKIVVAAPGIGDEFKPLGEKEHQRVRDGYGIKKPFILYLGTIDPRKNISLLINAFARLKDATGLNLVIAGKKGWMYEKLSAEVESLGLTSEVIFTGYVPDEDRPVLYSAAEIFVYPSFFEGFGIPVVEAQACGAPVITSNVSALPEAAGEAAILINPDSTEELKDALEKLLASAKLRGSLREKGFVNARKFRWDRSAKKVLSLFDRLEEE